MVRGMVWRIDCEGREGRVLADWYGDGLQDRLIRRREKPRNRFERGLVC